MRWSTWQIAWRNLGRNRKRTLLAMGAIALGQFTLVFVGSFSSGSFDNMIKTVTGPLVGHVQIHHKGWREERAIDLYIDNVCQITTELKSIPEVKVVSARIFAPALAAAGEETDAPATAEPAVIVGVDIGSESDMGGLLEFLPESDIPEGDSVLVGKVLARRLNVRPGELLALIGQDVDGFPVSNLFRIKAVLESNVEIVNSMGIVMPLEQAGDFVAISDQAHEIVIRGQDYKNADALAKQITSLPLPADAEVISWFEAVPFLTNIFEMRKWSDLIFMGIVFIAAAAGIANTSMMSTFERTHEFGMLLALGSRPGRIINMVLIESVIIGLIGVVIGSLLGVVLVLITAKTGIDYAIFAGDTSEDITFAWGGINISYVIYPVLELKYLYQGLIAVTGTSILASVWPSLLGARLEPVEAMRT
ncbi:MAG: ABC transporter permease [Sedimentisphaerales bacterium]|nr:ABC transporter permease [Sedimentisphaerales bacterium]